jgi:hypothetical protein
MLIGLQLCGLQALPNVSVVCSSHAFADTFFDLLRDRAFELTLLFLGSFRLLLRLFADPVSLGGRVLGLHFSAYETPTTAAST